MPYVAVHHPEKCHRYGVFCEIIGCPGAGGLILIGCGAYVLTCPHHVLELAEEQRQGETYIEVNVNLVRVPDIISIKDAF